MLSTPAFISVAFVRGMFSGLLRGGRLPGSAERELLVQAGLAPDLLDQPSACITADQYAHLMRLLMGHFNDEALGFLSRPLRPGTLALLAGSALGAATLGGALRRFARAFTLVQDDVEVQVVSVGAQTGVELRFTDPAVVQPVFLHELLPRVFWRVLAWLASGRLQVERFDFAFARPVHADSYAKLFPGQVVFDQPFTAFWLDTLHLQGPVRRDKAALRNFLADAQVYMVLPYLGEDTLSARLRTHLLHAQPRWPDLEECAAALHMAVSTLQRRLASEGTSFRTLRDSLRRDIAIARLNSSSAPLATLAGELGFADSAAFQRAFKAWTGLSPGSFRRTGRPPWSDRRTSKTAGGTGSAP